MKHVEAGLTGVGYLGNDQYGMVSRGIWNSYRDIGEISDFLRRDSFAKASRRFGRFDWESKRVFAGVGLALSDARGASRAAEKRARTGILAVNREGALRTNVEYFEDYLAGGRKFGRANLFIYTLPTSPLAEAAIHYGLRGPLVYAAREGESSNFALRYAETMLAQADAMIAIVSNQDEMTCFVVERLHEKVAKTAVGIETVVALLAGEAGASPQRLEGLWARERAQ